MAGKTFTGIGVDDLLRQKPPLPSNAAADAVPADAGGAEEDVHTVNSEPTVVDEDKVAEGLQRLRSLQTIHGMPSARPNVNADEGRPRLVIDASSSEPTRIGLPAARPTAVGRSSALEPPGKQKNVEADLRGTMYGHSVHLPDIHRRIEADDTPSAPVYMPPPQPGAPTTQLVPYVEPRMPSFHGVEAYPRYAQPFRRPAADDVEPTRTETIPPLGRRGYLGAILVLFGLAAAGLATLAWMHFRGEGDDGHPFAPAAASSESPAPAAEPSAPPAVPGSAAPSAGVPVPAPSVPSGRGSAPPSVDPTPAPGASGSAAAEGGGPLPTGTPERAHAPGADKGHHSARPDRKRTPSVGAPASDDGVGAAAKPKPARKGPGGEDDPDATLPPSSLD
jgi:hypothetical protein